MKQLNMNLGADSYPIYVGENLLNDANKYFNLNRKVLIVTDSGIPKEYAKAIASQASSSKIVTVDEGEDSKSMETLNRVLREMCEFNMGRTDCAIAVGGGVCGDLCGFASSIYMRGIDFYNVPTTVLSQVDSSIGGKTAVNFNGVKNIIGSFHQPKAVLIDTLTLKTLPERQVANGLAESVKMALTSDEELFKKFEKLSKEEIFNSLEEIILSSLKIKKTVVEQDEKETGLRKILNFGHTLGHGIEASCESHGLYHGECVSLGMIPMSSAKIRERVVSVLNKIGLPTEYKGDIDKALDLVVHDKKCAMGIVSAICVNEVGKYEIVKMEVDDFKRKVLDSIK